MNREELIELGNKIITGCGTEKEHLELCKLFDANVIHPNGSNLFYYPENFNARRDKDLRYNPTVEEVVEKCLSYKPIIL
ncbi:bacteriocin immunity protein [Joostella atrarenae]|uniref:Bacteriocin immunity protein n=1 Tax=Joostella atrarenae TaxID=679257 RepID=A0ABS9J7K7_9FLAO|nr:bacteriocin immunity protein [Joostella atrarenae]MCF8716417.1 bacteriocin immunity protein [Joostella atrarenae]